MKIDFNNPITNTTNLKTTEYTINVNATTFELLFRKLYSNPIKSIIRELVSNARDAHVEAGTQDTPIEVVLPTRLEPEFIVKDYGTGLSPEQMVEVYTVGFCSTKQNSNDYLGCYGLGSKSPLSYTDQYIVESRYHGTKRTYLIFINERGVPNLSEPIETISTDEPNGLTVRLNVKANDEYKFRSECSEALHFFNVTCNTDIPKLKAIYAQKDFTIYESHYTIDNHAYAKIGGVLYPLDLETLGINYERYATKKYTLVLNVPIGKVSITPNRENLNYDSKTTTYLLQQLSLVTNHFHSTIRARILLSKTENEATKNTLAMRELLSKLNGVLHRCAFFFPGSNTPLGNSFTYKSKGTAFTTIQPSRRSITKLTRHDEKSFKANTSYTLYFAGPKTLYVNNWIKENIRESAIVIRAKNPGEEAICVSNFLATINSTCTVAHIPTIKRPRETRPTNVRVQTLQSTGEYRDLHRLDCTHYILEGDSYQSINIKPGMSLLWLINELRAAHIIDFKDAILLPKSKKSLINRLELTNARPILDNALPDLIEHHKELLIYVQVYRQLPHTESHFYHIPTKGDHPLITLINKLRRATYSTSLYNQIEFSTTLKIPKPTTELEEARKLLETYEPLINVNSTSFPKLLAVYDTHLENNTNV